MADVPAKFQLFAITFLLATPSELHHVWIEQGQPWDTVANELRGLGFSEDAIKSAKENIDDKLTSELKASFINLAETIEDLPVYDAGSHPGQQEAGKIASKLREADQSIA
jgi:hypothetical protein